jgi:hypothetical protein
MCLMLSGTFVLLEISWESMRMASYADLLSVRAMTLGKLGWFAECRGLDTRQTRWVCLVPCARTLGKAAKFAECRDYGTRQICR